MRASFFDKLSPELKLVLCCSAPIISEDDNRFIEGLFEQDIDWELFFKWTLYHRLYPLVYHNLLRMKWQGVPEATAKALKKVTQENNARALNMVGELIRILHALEHKGIEAVVLKGFPLSYQLYGNVAFRSSSDVDILVQPKDFPLIQQVAEELGYVRLRPSNEIIAKELAAWMEKHHTFDYWKQDRQISLELHWQLCSEGIRIPDDEMISSLKTVKFAQKSIKVLSGEVLVLYLISHGSGHAWCNLFWLRDLDALIRQGGFSWERLYMLAEGLDAVHYINLSLVLARDLLRTPLPENISRILEADDRANDLAAQAFGLMTTLGYNQNRLNLLQWTYYLDQKYRVSLLNGRLTRLEYILLQMGSCIKAVMVGLWRRISNTKQE